MADDVTLPGTGAIVAADEIAGKKHQRVKVQFGEDGVATDASSANPFPVAAIGGATAEGQADTIAAVGEVAALQAGTNTKLDDLILASEATDTVNVAQDTSALKNGATSLTPKFAKIALSASGDLVAAVTGKKIRVLAYNLIVATDVTVKFQSGGTLDITGVKTLGAKGGLVAPFNPLGWFETAAAAKLNLVLGGSVVTGGELVYVEV